MNSKMKIFRFNFPTVCDRKSAVTDCRLAERNRAEQSITEKSIAERAESAERALKREPTKKFIINNLLFI